MPESAANNDRGPLRVLYCRCAYARVVPEEVKDAVLEGLCASGRPFDTVADLCEMSARRDPALTKIAAATATAEGDGGPGGTGGSGGAVKIAACYPRAVRGLFRAAEAPLTEGGYGVLNMRTRSAEQVLDVLVNGKPIDAAGDEGRGDGDGQQSGDNGDNAKGGEA